MMPPLLLLLLILLSTFHLQGVNTAICPLSKHVVCNSNFSDRKCLCAMSLDDSPPPQQSCSHIVEKEVTSSKSFEAVSITFRLDNISQTDFDFPERRFRRELASHIKTDERSIVFLRLRCSNEDGDGSEITAQLIVLKRDIGKGRNPTVPFKETDLLETRVAVSRIKSLTQLAGLEVTGVDKVNHLYAVESYTDNGRLIIEACLAALFILTTSLCGCWIACKNKSTAAYDDELQKV